MIKLVSLVLSIFFNLSVLADESTYFEHKDFKKYGKVSIENFSHNCYSTDCLSNNLRPLLELASDVNNSLSDSTADWLRNYQKIPIEEIQIFLSKLKKTSKLITREELELYIAPVISQMPALDERFAVGFQKELIQILQACNTGNFLEEIKKNSVSSITNDIIRGSTYKCVYDLHGTFSLFDDSKFESCEKLVRESLEIIDLTGDAGDFATVYSQFVIENPRFDEMILQYMDLIESRLLDDSKGFFQDPNYGLDLDVSNLSQHSARLKRKSNYLKDFDPGLEALKITKGNLKDAARLLQIVASDPGSQGIRKYLAYELMGSNPERAVKLRKFLHGQPGEHALGIGKLSGKFFGKDFHYKWSPRNYKATAGLALGIELSERGYSTDEVGWAAQFVGEAYRAQYVLGNTKDRDKERPYFIIDSSAHYVGGVLGSIASRGQSLDDFNREYTKLKAQGEEQAENTWDKIEDLGSFQEVIQKANNFLSRFE